MAVLIRKRIYATICPLNSYNHFPVLRYFFLITFVVQLHGLSAQISPPDSLRLWVSEALVEQGEELDIFFTVSNFDSLVSLQFSINWDPTVISFIEFERLDLGSVAIGEGQANEGILRFSWFSPEGVVETLPDSSRILRLRFLAVGPQGAQTPVAVTGNPLPIQIFKGDGEDSGEFIPVPLIVQHGRVRIESPFDVQIEATDPICRGDSTGTISLTTTANPDIYAVVWTNEDGDVIPESELDNLPAGTYQVAIIDDLGDTVFESGVSLNQPSLSLQLNSPIVSPQGCEGPDGSVELSALGGDAPYTYTLGGSSNIIGIFNNLAANTYEWTVVDERGCTISGEVEIEQVNQPVLDMGEPLRSFCDGMPILLQPTVDQQVDYFWSNGDQDPVILATEPGTYVLTVTNGSSCFAVDSVVLVEGDNVEAVLETPLYGICPGDSIQLEVSGGTSFAWIGTSAGLNRTDSRTVWARPETSTTYSIEVRTECSVDTLEIPVEVFELTATAGLDTCVVLGESVQLRASGGLFYTWEDHPLYPVDNPISPVPFVSPEETTIYRVLIEDINGCLIEDEVEVRLADNPADNILAVNAITPNFDGDNDVLEFGSLAKYGQNSLRIYNRWGRLVYNKLNYQSDEERFDGNYLGDPLPAGSYYYVLEFRTGTIKQTLLIIR